ncbi:MAG TPA: LCP family protein [Aeromicrobium sp.]|nr:LCP family protein [Aeromicrobium sp.]
MREPRTGVFAPSRAQMLRASQRVKFRRALSLIVFTLLLPGSAQLLMGNRRIGRIAIRVWLGFLVVGAILGVLALTSRTVIFWLAANGQLLLLGRWILMAAALAWVALILDAWRLGAPLQLARKQRLWMTGLNSALCLGVGSVMFFAAHLVSVQTGVLDTVFVSNTVSGPKAGRYNVLLLGGDSGKGRDGLRPDSLTVASINAETGKSVLIGLPRNLQKVPFSEGSIMAKHFPHGFTWSEGELNAVNTWATNHKDLFPESDTRSAGVQATISAVEAITDLDINYYAMVNLKGFSSLVDAVGGVTVNVKEKTAIGGIGSPIRGYIPAGKQKLNGDQTLWYARSRVNNDDWSRMGRQKCVMSAMLHQLSPQKVLFNAQAIAESGTNLVTTDIPAQQLGSFMDLALKARAQNISTVSLVPPKIYTGNPDYEKVRRIIRQAIDKADGKPVGGILDAELSVPQPKSEAKKDTKSSNQSEDLAETC